MFDPILLPLLGLSYLLGAIPFAVLVGRRLRGVDVRRVGSGNTGAMNTLRSAGWQAGLLVVLLDGLKAALAMALGWRVLGPQAATLCGAAAVVGHCFSPFLLYAARADRGGGWKMALRRSGGKGLASGLAVLLVTDWRLGLLTVALFFAALALLRKDETWPTIIAVIGTPALAWWLTRSAAITVAIVIVGAIVIVKHLPDMREGFYVSMPHEP